MKNCFFSADVGARAAVVLAVAGLSACSSNNWFSKRDTTPDPRLAAALNGPAPSSSPSSQGRPPLPELGTTSTTTSTDNPAASMSMSSSATAGEGSNVGVATTTPVGAPTGAASANVVPHRPGKVDPFWIEVNAEADRAKWENDPLASSRGAVPDAQAIASSLGVQPGIGGGDELAEGLTHETTAPVGSDFDPCVSRDGEFMVFASTQHRPTAAIYLKSTHGRTITQLTSDPAHNIMPSISPDGKRIAYASNRDGNWDIFVMSATGGQAVQITSDPAHELHPSWSPDGSKIVFCRLGQISGRWEMWVTDVNGGTSSEFIGYGLFPQWCPIAGTGMGGRDKILFQRSRERGGRAFSIWTVDYKPGDTSSPTEICSSAMAAMINPSWSPDGTRVVFATVENPSAQSTNVNGPQTVASDLWMINIDGSARVNLTSGGVGGQFMNLMPWWASNGRIYFVSDRSGIPNIWSMGTEKAIQAATSGVALDMKTPTRAPMTARAMPTSDPTPAVGRKPAPPAVAPAPAQHQAARPRAGAPAMNRPAETPGFVMTTQDPRSSAGNPGSEAAGSGENGQHTTPVVTVPEDNSAPEQEGN